METWTKALLIMQIPIYSFVLLACIYVIIDPAALSHQLRRESFTSENVSEHVETRNDNYAAEGEGPIIEEVE